MKHPKLAPEISPWNLWGFLEHVGKINRITHSSSLQIKVDKTMPKGLIREMTLKQGLPMIEMIEAEQRFLENKQVLGTILKGIHETQSLTLVIL